MSTDFPVCSTESTPTARIRHRCCECDGVVEPGQQYQRITGVWEGAGQSFKTCLPCVSLRAAYTAQVLEEGYWASDFVPGLGDLFADMFDSRELALLELELPRLDAACAWETAAFIRQIISEAAEYANA